jgi:catalase
MPASALVFELSKVSIGEVRRRVLANLVNVDPNLAGRVAGGLNMEVPDASPAAAPVQDLALSPALRIIGGPLELHTLRGRSVGILVSDGSNRLQIPLRQRPDDHGSRAERPRRAGARGPMAEHKSMFA